jgi:outer membrane protein OmpA-like peptidoglycan-associated protein
LLVHFGVDAKRVITRGFGKQKPRVGGFGEEQRAENRRVEFTITRVRPAKVGTR